MATNSRNPQPPLVDSILQLGKLAFGTEISSDDLRQKSLLDFNALLDGTSTIALVPVLNLLIQEGRTEASLRTALVASLALLPLRNRGVQDTIEFILSVHPSSRVSGSGGAEKRPGISHEALNIACRLLSTPPQGVAPDEWFDGIALQLFSLLQGEGEPEMDKAAAFIIGFGILGRKQYGAPGTPGWRAFIEPMVHNIDPAIGSSRQNASSEEPMVILGAPKILVSSVDVSKSLGNLSTLLTAHPHPSLVKRVLRPIFLALWSLSSWDHKSKAAQTTFSKPAMKLLRVFIQLLPSSKSASDTSGQLTTSSTLEIILQNLMFRGRPNSERCPWEYAEDKDGGIHVQRPNESSRENFGPNMSKIDFTTDKFIELLTTLGNAPGFNVQISHLFMGLCTEWMSSQTTSNARSILTRLEPAENPEDIENRLMKAKVMQKMMASFPDNLVTDTHQVLDLVKQLLFDFNVGGGDENSEDAVAVALSLLNIVLTSPSFKTTTEEAAISAIQASLQSVSRLGKDISTTAQNLLLLLQFRGTFNEPENTKTSIPTDQQLEDRKSYNLALSYLTTTDSPPPIRAQGLELLSGLIKTRSTILDIPALLVTFSTMLQDTEEYIYLRAIQSFIQLSQRHPKAVIKDLIERYVDPHEDYELDQRLRLGEALLQVIQNTPLSYTGDISRTVSEGLLFLASRRGYRLKTEQAQKKAAQLKVKQDAEAAEAWDGEVPQLDEVLEMEAQKEEDLLSQILSGWESKRGSEDLRIRASALAILGSSFESNISSLPTTTLSTSIDLSIHILTLEPSPESAIVRRSAIILIMSFVKALDTARNQGKKLGFGFVGKSLQDVQRILGYVAETDNDELVRRHAVDVGEGLQAWQVNELITVQGNVGDVNIGIGELRGLRIRPRDEEGSREGRVKPGIEEIE